MTAMARTGTRGRVNRLTRIDAPPSVSAAAPLRCRAVPGAANVISFALPPLPGLVLVKPGGGRPAAASLHGRQQPDHPYNRPRPPEPGRLYARGPCTTERSDLRQCG